MDKWCFVQDAVGLWGWQYTPSLSRTEFSGQRFSSRTDCIADAMRHGYLAIDDATPEQSAAERRQDSAARAPGAALDSSSDW
jgi:hypothetical protein